jgi:tripartite-type tricarboxylate transporter receptor subunit TctC
MHVIAALLAALPLVATAGEAIAQSNYPTKPIRMIVGFAPAGPADLIARVIGDKLTEAWGQSVVIENVTGAGANIAGDRVAKAAPDGYTLLLASLAQLTINPSLYDKMPFDTVKDVIPITQAVFTPNILALNNDVPAKSVAELVALARAQPGQLTYGSAGVGTSQHLAGELFKSMAHVDIRHVPYRGAAPVITDLLGGRITMFFGNVTAVLPQVQDGKLRALAVTSLKRVAAAPDLPDARGVRLSRLRRDGVVRPGGAGGHAAGDHRQASPRNGADSGAARRAQTFRRAGLGGDCQFAGRILRRHQGRDSAMGEADQRGRNPRKRLRAAGTAGDRRLSG